jgi:hypothetical protein
MNTTKFITLASMLFLGLTISSCKKEGCTDSAATNYSSEADKDDGSCIYAQTPPAGNAIDGNPKVKYTIDGVSVSQEANMTFFSATGASKNIGQSTTDAVWSSYLYDDVEQYAIFDVSKGVLTYPNGSLSDSEFYDYFMPGTYTYADLSEEGVGIKISPLNGVVYSSNDGPQVGSTFEIVSRKKVQVGVEMQVKVHIKFNCKVYGAGTVKTITNGVYVGNFSQ